MPAPNPQPPVAPEPGRGCLAALARLAWIFGGITMIFAAVFIAQGRGGLAADLGLFVLALLIILVRFVDIRYLRGETLDNQPATLKTWRRYALFVAAAAAVLYAVGKFLAAKNIF